MFINIIQYFEEKILPFNLHKTAVIDNGTSYTFHHIASYSKALASNIINLDKNTRQPIAIFLNKSVLSIIADMAVMYSSNIYMNLDTKSPINRIEKILANIQPIIIITDSFFYDKVASVYRGYIINIDTFDFNCSYEQKSIIDRYNKHIDTDPLCIINTSGSTDIPKSVVLNTRSFIDFINWSLETMPFDTNDVIGSLSPVVFDIYSFELYLMLIQSNTIVLIPDKFTPFPAKILELLEKNNVTFIFWVPTIMVNIANMELLSKYNLNSLKLVWFAGEVFPTKQLNYWRKILHNAMFVNMYGPIEITLDCSYFIVDRDFDNNEPLPIGIPCRNTDILILDGDNLITEPYLEGELCVRGTSLAMGYYNNFEKTLEVFTQNPLNDKYPELIYRTGDIVKLNEKGEILFCGRKDSLIKHLGYRIELGEIEHTIVSSLGLVKNVCILYNHEKKEIVCIYENNIEISPTDFRKNIGLNLPKYMIPTKYIQIQQMPKNTNGKIDRFVLKKYINNNED